MRRAIIVFRQAARAVRRDLRNPHLLVVAIALIVAVSSMTAVASFTDRVRRALESQAGQLLAGDLALQASQPLPAELRGEAAALGLVMSEQLAMRSMVTHAHGMQMVEMKAVDAHYPLRGTLLVATQAFGKPRTAARGPAPGMVWVEARLLSALKLELGDRLRLGTAEFTIDAVLTLEPDRAGDLFSIAPRAMLNLADISATGLVVPGSRVQYNLTVAGDAAAVATFATSARAKAQHRYRVLDPSEARPEVRSALEHANQFLGLAALVATVLSGIAILVGAQSFAREQLDAIAVMRTLGASRNRVGVHFTLEVLLLGVLAAGIGAGAGVLLEFGLAHALSGWIQGDLPRASLAAPATGFAAGVLALLGFALPQLLALRDVPPARVLRRDLAWRAPSTGVVLGFAASSVALLAPWQAGDPRLTLYTLGGMAICLALLLGLGRAIISLAAMLRRGRQGFRWHALANLTRRPALTSLQLCAMGLSLMAMLLLWLIRTDLVASWATSLPPNAPDQFLINIQAEDVARLESFLREHGINPGGIYSMARARLVAINEQEIKPDDYTDPRARRLVDREFNLSGASTLKADNRLVAGEFWTADSPLEQFSFEEEIAATLGIKLGDRITYQIAAQTLTGTVTSLRAVNWETMEANFFVVSPPQWLADFPATYITSFKLPDGKFELLRELAERFPSITVIDVMALVRQVRAVMDRALAAIEFVFLFTLAAGLTVVFAAVQATHAERVHDATVMKALGATRHRILGLISIEFLALGAIAGTIGAVIAIFAARVLALEVLNIPFQLNPWWLGAGVLLGISAVWLAGLRAIVATWRQPVADILREWG